MQLHTNKSNPELTQKTNSKRRNLHLEVYSELLPHHTAVDVNTQLTNSRSCHAAAHLTNPSRPTATAVTKDLMLERLKEQMLVLELDDLLILHSKMSVDELGKPKDWK